MAARRAAPTMPGGVAGGAARRSAAICAGHRPCLADCQAIGRVVARRWEIGRQSFERHIRNVPDRRNVGIQARVIDEPEFPAHAKVNHLTEKQSYGFGDKSSIL